MINKIFKQRMDDPEPLEKIARGVPAAFAAIVRKLMAKKPEERYQTCAELRTDLARWTDPCRLRAILGAEAEAARSFHPPPPPLADEDLRLLSIADDSEPERALAPRPGRGRAVARPSPPPPSAPASGLRPAANHPRPTAIRVQRRHPLAAPLHPGRPRAGPGGHPDHRLVASKIRAWPSRTLRNCTDGQLLGPGQ